MCKHTHTCTHACTHTHTHTQYDCSRNWVLILVGAEIEEEGFQFGFKRWQGWAALKVSWEWIPYVGSKARESTKAMSLEFVLLTFWRAGVTVDSDHGRWRVVAETLSVLWAVMGCLYQSFDFLNFVSHVSVRNLIMWGLCAQYHVCHEVCHMQTSWCIGVKFLDGIDWTVAKLSCDLSLTSSWSTKLQLDCA